MNVRARREKEGLTQAQFWGLFGVKQNMGSRYENGLRIPAPVKLLIAVWASGVDLNAKAILDVAATVE
jgi:transcriptional regulator with XRE-family HTH domain